MDPSDLSNTPSRRTAGSDSRQGGLFLQKIGSSPGRFARQSGKDEKRVRGGGGGAYVNGRDVPDSSSGGAFTFGIEPADIGKRKEERP